MGLATQRVDTLGLLVTPCRIDVAGDEFLAQGATAIADTDGSLGARTDVRARLGSRMRFDH
jgi:hypothetical protein